MTARILDELVEAGLLSSYEYEQIDDTNTYGQTLYYKRLILIFPDGTRVRITGNKNMDLYISRDD